jgi:hypothetical protein
VAKKFGERNVISEQEILKGHNKKRLARRAEESARVAALGLSL